MTGVITRLAALAAMLLSGVVVGARAEAGGEGGEGTELWAVWSVTAIGQYTSIPSPENDDDVGGWFDQYEFTPNKSSDFPFQLGLRDAALDVFRGETAIFQARLWSPSSNLGVSGSAADAPFFNQRLEALTRLKGLDLDLSYRRIRTEQLRLFPATQGPGLVFDDRSSRDDRFLRDRTGFSAEARVRPYEALDLREVPGDWIRPELSLRGGYESRDGARQVRFLRPPSNQWLGLSRDSDRSVGEVGGGLLVAPDGLLTLTFDFDHERLRLDDPVLAEGDLGFGPPEDVRSVDFIPETNRYTGTIRFNSRLGDRAVIEGGFLVSELEQVSEYTPEQRAAGLRDNSVRYYGANAALDLRLLENLSFQGVFKYDRRENDIERQTSLFDDASQVDPFVEDWERYVVAGEFELQCWGRSHASLGLKYEDVSRDLDFSTLGSRILPESTHIERDTRIVTLYGRASARPWRRLRVNAELGYRWAPDTGYAMDLDHNLFGELRASYAFAFARPVLVSGYVRGSTGENDDFTVVSGAGPVPNGTRLPRSYERSSFVTGVTATGSPIDRITLSASFFYRRDDTDSTLDVSTVQRYFQPAFAVDFARDGKSRFENEQTSLVLGLHAQLTERTTGSVSYAFTRAEADYSGSDSTVALDLIADNHQIRSDAHVVDFELRHEVMAGLEVLGGYRYQDYDDDASLPQSVASATQPFDRSTHQHTVTVGATLTSEFFER
jgi:hypothetical protein